MSLLADTMALINLCANPISIDGTNLDISHRDDAIFADVHSHWKPA